MREIRFRAWNGKKVLPVARIEHGYESYSTADGEVYLPTTYSIELANGDFLSFDPSASFDERLMQYTGLQDKNGVDVYEGDLTSDYDDGAYPYEIVWGEERAQFMKRRGGSDSTLTDLKHQRVIGNIYENPELLTTGRA